MSDRDIAVKFTGDSRDLERASNDAERSLTGASKGIGSAFSSIAGPAALVTAGLVTAGAVAWSFAEAAMEDDAAAQSLAYNLRQAAGASDEAVDAAEDYISTLSKQVAVADDELRPALSTLAVATGDVDKAQRLLKLSTDIAAATGKDLGTVTDAVAKAQLGSVAGLSKMGIATKDAAGETMTLDDILAGATQRFDGAGAAAAETASGGLKKAQIGIGELQESIGEKMLPVLAALAKQFNEKVLPAFERVVKWVEANWPRIMGAIQPGLDNLKRSTDETLGEVQRFWAEWGDDITGTLRWLSAIWENEFLIILDVASWAMKFAALIIGAGMGSVVNIVKTATAIFRTDWEGVWKDVLDLAKLGVFFLWNTMSGIPRSMVDAMRGVAEIISGPFRTAFDAVADLWNRTVGSLNFEFPEWIPGMGGRRIDVPDIPRFSAMGALTIVMPPGTDGYDVARQAATFSRTVAPIDALTVAVR